MDKEDDQLLQQFHFYFSDSNLAKDKFLKEKITENEGGWVPLSLFMTFNKYDSYIISEHRVKELTNDPKKIYHQHIPELSDKSPYWIIVVK